MQLISSLKNLLKTDRTYVGSPFIKWSGTEYGGFYLDFSLLNPSSNLFSFGVGEDISFDLAAGELGVKNVFLFDPTPKSIEFIKKTKLPDNFHFFPFGISDKDEDADFFLPKNDNSVSGSLSVHKKLDTQKIVRVQLKKLSTILAELNVHRVDVLKIDIEGSEYKVLKNIISESIFPIQICVEFHNEFFKTGKEMFDETLQLLENNLYNIKAISKTGKELLFVRDNKSNK